MIQNRLTHLTAIAAAAGGACWLAKMLVIAVTDGAVDNESAAAAFYLLGVVLLAAGAGTVTLRLLARGPLTTALAVLLAPILFFASFVVLEGIAKALAGDAGPSWFGEEVGILATGAVWLAVGVALLRRTAAR